MDNKTAGKSKTSVFQRAGGLKNAVLVSEILGKPVSLKNGGAGKIKKHK